MYGLIQIAALPLALLVVGSPQASDGEAGAIPPSAAAGSGIPPSTGELPAVLRGYTEELEYAAGIGRGCVVLEGADILFAVRTLDVAAPFEQYRDRVRAAVDLVAKDIARLDEADPRAKDGDGRREAIARIKTKHRAQVYAAIDAAQAELMLALDADATTRQRMIRHALWREVRDGTDTNGLDAGMLLEDDSEPTSMKLRAAIAADPKAAGRMRELLAAHDLRAGPARESGIAVHRAMYDPDAVRNAASMERLAKSLSGVRSANETLLDGIAATARECGASAESFEWRARAFKLRAPQLLPATDLLDTFDLARTAGDAMDADAMRAARWACPTFVDRLIMSFACAFGKPVRT